MIIVGVDSATDSKRVGMALGTYDGSLSIESARVAKNRDDLIETLVGWLKQSDSALLALDAPLGWPLSLGDQLHKHSAGNSIKVEPHSMFRRHTDIEIKRRLGQQPLDVGADRIARTAMAALGVIEEIRQRLAISLGWTPGNVKGRTFIEVYPAATLKAMGINNKGYKKRESTQQRREILNALPLTATCSSQTAAEENDDVLDAIICAVAAVDYAYGKVVSPPQLVTAKKGGLDLVSIKTLPPVSHFLDQTTQQLS